MGGRGRLLCRPERLGVSVGREHQHVGEAGETEEICPLPLLAPASDQEDGLRRVAQHLLRHAPQKGMADRPFSVSPQDHEVAVEFLRFLEDFHDRLPLHHFNRGHPPGGFAGGSYARLAVA